MPAAFDGFSSKGVVIDRPDRFPEHCKTPFYGPVFIENSIQSEF